MSVTFNNGTSRAQALVALWNATNALGYGVLHSHHTPSEAEAEEVIEQHDGYVDYFMVSPLRQISVPSLRCEVECMTAMLVKE